MFWNKKTKSGELEASASFFFERHYEAVAEINLQVESLEAKLDLILDHLKLKYVPETETKEPAKLVEKTNQNPFFDLKNGAIIQVPNGLGGLPLAYDEGKWEIASSTKPKKKRGRPKKK